MTRWIIILLIFVFLEFYAFQAVRSLWANKWATLAYFGISGFIILNFFLRRFVDHAGSHMLGVRAYAFGMLLALLTAQVVLVLFIFTEDIVRFIIGLFSKQTYTEKSLQMPSRRRFIS